MLHNQNFDIIKQFTTVVSLSRYIRKKENKHILEWLIENTSYLKPDSTLAQRHWSLCNDFKFPKCKMCENQVRWNETKHCNATYCSRECVNSDKDLVIKYKETMLAKYGYTSPLHVPEIKEKVKSTMLEKYGSYYCATKECQIKNKEYHKEHINDIKQKRKNTTLERYNTEYATQSDIIKQRIKENNLKNFGLVHNTTPESRIKARETSQRKHGTDHPLQNPEVIKAVKLKNIKEKGYYCYQLSDLSKEALDIINTPGKLYELNESIGTDQVCQILNVGASRCYSILRRNGVEPVIPIQSSLGELELQTFISQNYNGNIVLNDRKILKGKELDIYLPDLNIGFEYNGEFWHSEVTGNKDSKYHLYKHETCKQSGIQLMFIKERYWNNKKDIIKSKILHLLGINNKIYARNTKIVIVDTKEEQEFLNSTHIQGYIKSNIAIGLEHNGMLVAIMSFTKSRYDKHYEYELLRFATKNSVVGGASKLLSYFIKNYKPSSILSYANKEFSNGSVYKQLGFTLVSETKPSYEYTKNYLEFFNRIKFQKHKLEKLLETYDSNLSEWENMQANGYDRIWDCGHYKFVLQCKIN